MASVALRLAELERLADPAKAAEMAAYHKAPRTYLGVANPAIDALAARWREGASVAERVALAHGLWASDVHEARIAAAKLLTQARIREDEPRVWAEFLAWVPDFDAWALAETARSSFLSLDSSLAAVRENMRVAEIGYREGVGTAAAVIDARARLNDVQTQRLAAAYEYDVALAALMAASGRIDDYGAAVSSADQRIMP